LRELARVAVKTRDRAIQSELFAFAAGEEDVAKQRAALRGALDALPKGKSRQGWLSFLVTPPALLAIVRTNNQKTQPLANELLAAVALEVANAELSVGGEVTASERKILHAGEKVFASLCAACHQLDGNGMQGLAPPLRDSEWVTGEPSHLIRIALYGVRGPIEAAGEKWDREMPGQRHLADSDLAAALSYLRRAFGHRESLITAAAVAKERKANGKRTEPWTVAELLGEK
jgi:mono/diheme cytochrome c family protein